MKTTSIAFITSFILLGCKVQEMKLKDADKHQSIIVPVKGRQGLLINQKLSFGDFKAFDVKRGWIKTYNMPFVVAFSGASEKISFRVTHGKDTAAVFALGKISVSELNLLNDFFRIPLKNTDVFAGSVNMNGKSIWRFYITNAGNSIPDEPSVGYITNDTVNIEIKNIRELNGHQNRFTKFDIYGYEFIKDGKFLGAVETINNGKVYLAYNNTKESNLLIASISSAILLRNDLNERRLEND